MNHRLVFKDISISESSIRKAPFAKASICSLINIKEICKFVELIRHYQCASATLAMQRWTADLINSTNLAARDPPQEIHTVDRESVWPFVRSTSWNKIALESLILEELYSLTHFTVCNLHKTFQQNLFLQKPFYLQTLFRPVRSLKSSKDSKGEL